MQRGELKKVGRQKIRTPINTNPTHMAVVHFLNVLEGDCNIIQHDSGRVSVIDVSNADNNIDTEAEKLKKQSLSRQAMFSMTVPTGKKNYEQKKYPDNPITYLRDKLGATKIFRFIITHPDMDHLDGLKDLFDTFPITCVWDTDNKKEIINFNGGGYNKEDWDFYKTIRDGKPTNRRAYLANNSCLYFNEDMIRILAPTKSLCDQANESGDYNDSSFVLLFTPPKNNGQNWKILFAGDSHDKTWEYILNNYEAEVSDIDVLFAPHHGRDSNRNYDFLKTLKPQITLLGNASSQHLAYDQYPETRITNNQAGHVILDVDQSRLKVLVKNQEFANDFCNNPKRNAGTPLFDPRHAAYLLGHLAV
jgi:competence protein ComEC